MRGQRLQLAKVIIKQVIRKLYHLLLQQKECNMTIKPPAWCVGAVPEMKRGWVDPNSNELLVSSRFTQAQIDEFYGVPSFQTIQDMNQEGKIQAEMKRLGYSDDDTTFTDVADTPNELDLESMTKKQLEDLGRDHGVELDRRKSKTTLLKTMK